jgi:hypothetical protein
MYPHAKPFHAGVFCLLVSNIILFLSLPFRHTQIETTLGITSIGIFVAGTLLVLLSAWRIDRDYRNNLPDEC